MGQPTINADEPLKGLARSYLTAPRLLWCYPRQPMRSKSVGLSVAHRAASLCDTEELRVHTHT